MRTMWPLMLILALAQQLTGCVNPSGTETPKPVVTVVDTACKWVRPIMIGNADQLTEETARQIEVHNETWEVNCGTRTGNDQTVGRQDIPGGQ